MATISSLVVELTLMADTFNNNLRTAQKEAREFEKTMKPTQRMLEDVGSTMTTVGASISAIGVPFALVAKRAIDTADAFSEMAERTGASVEALSSIAVEADLAGTSIGAVEKAFRASSKVLEDAASGSKAAAASIEKIGLATEDLVKMSPDQRFFAIAKALNEIQDPGMKAALAMEVYGKTGAEIVPILDEMAKGQDSVMASADKLGKLISTSTAKSANEFNDAMAKLAMSLAGVVNKMIETGLLDKITDLANRMADVIGNFSKAHPNIVAVGGVLGGLAAVVGPLVAGIGLLVSGIAGLIPVGTQLLALVGGTAGITSALSAVGAVLTGPVGIVAACIAATAALSAFVMKNETLSKLLDPVWNAIGNAINVTVDFIKKLWDDLWNFIVGAPARAKDAILGSVKSVTDGITGFFKGMYDKVVGNSFVPDMLDRIQEEFSRLPDVMQNPVARSTMGVISAFEEMFRVTSEGAGAWSESISGIIGGGRGGGGIGGVMKTLEGAANGGTGFFNELGNIGLGAAGGLIGGAFSLGSLIGGLFGSPRPLPPDGFIDVGIDRPFFVESQDRINGRFPGDNGQANIDFANAYYANAGGIGGSRSEQLLEQILAAVQRMSGDSAARALAPHLYNVIGFEAMQVGNVR